MFMLILRKRNVQRFKQENLKNEKKRKSKGTKNNNLFVIGTQACIIHIQFAVILNTTCCEL